jgi:hypothetical protein
MTGKRELIQLICEVGKGETPEFLTNFPESELKDYYDYLKKKQESKGSKAAQMLCN